MLEQGYRDVLEALKKAAKTDIRYMAYLANAIATAATVERFVGGMGQGANVFPESLSAEQVADTLWHRLWLTGMLPIVLIDDIFRLTLGWYSDVKGPFVENLKAIIDRDRERRMDSVSKTWTVSAWTRAYLTLLFSVMPIIATEGTATVLRGMGSVVAGFGEIVPG